jgi:hypothetical protein
MNTKIVLMTLTCCFLIFSAHAQTKTKPSPIDSVAADNIIILNDFRFDDKILNNKPYQQGSGSWEDELRNFSYELSSWLKEIQQEEEVQMLKNELRKAWYAVKVEIDSTKAYLYSDEFYKKLERHNINWRPIPPSANEDIAFKTKVARTVKVTNPSAELLASFNKKVILDSLNLANLELTAVRSKSIIKV